MPVSRLFLQQFSSFYPQCMRAESIPSILYHAKSGDALNDPHPHD
jgi:hypothetical protein